MIEYAIGSIEFTQTIWAKKMGLTQEARLRQSSFGELVGWHYQCEIQQVN